MKAVSLLVAMMVAASLLGAQESTDQPADVPFEQLIADAIEARNTGDIEAALRLFSRAQSVEPTNGEVLYNRGSLYLDVGDYGRAVSLLEESIERGFEDSRAHFNLGVAKSAAGDAEGAIASYSRAVELDESDARGLVNRGLLFAQIGEPDQALRDWRAAVDREPELADGYYYLGNAAYESDRFEEAIELYDRALTYDASITGALFNRANALYRLGRFREAVDGFLAFLRFYPENRDALNNLGVSALEAAKVPETE